MSSFKVSDVCLINPYDAGYRAFVAHRRAEQAALRLANAPVEDRQLSLPMGAPAQVACRPTAPVGRLVEKAIGQWLGCQIKLECNRNKETPFGLSQHQTVSSLSFSPTIAKDLSFPCQGRSRFTGSYGSMKRRTRPIWATTTILTAVPPTMWRYSSAMSQSALRKENNEFYRWFACSSRMMGRGRTNDPQASIANEHL